MNQSITGKKTFNRDDSVLISSSSKQSHSEFKITAYLSYTVLANIPGCSEVGTYTNSVSH